MKHVNSTTHIQVGDFTITREEYCKLPLFEARIMKIIGRSVNTLVKKEEAMYAWAGDLLIHVYVRLRHRGDITEFSPDCDIQQAVKCLLKNAVRDAKGRYRNSAATPIGFKVSYSCSTEDSQPNTGKAIPLEIRDLWDGCDVQSQVAEQADSSIIRQAIEKIGDRQLQQCAQLLCAGISAQDAARQMGIKKSRFYEIKKEVIKYLRSLLKAN